MATSKTTDAWSTPVGKYIDLLHLISNAGIHPVFFYTLLLLFEKILNDKSGIIHENQEDTRAKRTGK